MLRARLAAVCVLGSAACALPHAELRDDVARRGRVFRQRHVERGQPRNGAGIRRDAAIPEVGEIGPRALRRIGKDLRHGNLDS